MATTFQRSDADPDALRREVSRVLRPYVEGTAKGMSDWVMTEARVARTARDAAEAIVPLLGSPARSAHRVRGLIVPVLTCGWTEFDEVYESALDELLALPPAVPGVEDPAWDRDLSGPRVAARDDWDVHGSTWSVDATEGGSVVGPSGTAGRLVRSDGRHVLIVEDGRNVRTRAKCTCSPQRRRERGEVGFELVTFGRGRKILEVKVGMTCGLCRAVVP